MRWRVYVIINGISKVVLIVGIIFSLAVPRTFAEENIRRPAVAEGFYPGNPAELNRIIDAFLGKAPKEELPGLIAMLVPHAGYSYSGQIAALAYKLIEPQDYDTIVLIGPSHRAPFSGISVYNEGYFETPLGSVEINSELANSIIEENERIKFYPQVHIPEHSLEVQLPFLQRIFKQLTIVPIIMGSQSKKDAEILSQALIKNIRGKKVLLLGTCDYSHDYPYSVAVKMDKVALTAIEKFDTDELYEKFNTGQCSMDAVGPVAAVMLAAKRLGADKVKVLKYANSGDVTGNKLGRIVGYASVVFYSNETYCCPAQTPVAEIQEL